MAIIKTSELTGNALDWAVATAEGLFFARLEIENKLRTYSPSTDWSQGGPIIEREIYKIWQNLNGTWAAQIKYREPYYSPTYDADIGKDAYIHRHGETPLIAAMRCYVASKLGDSVNIPDEIA